MRIFVGMKALRGDPNRLTLSNCVVQTIQETGSEAFLASAEIERRGLTDPQAFMPFVFEAMQHCQAALILYDAELRGGLIELGMAYALRLPVWLAVPSATERVSSSALGCSEAVLRYDSPLHLTGQLYRLILSRSPAR